MIPVKKMCSAGYWQICRQPVLYRYFICLCLISGGRTLYAQEPAQLPEGGKEAKPWLAFSSSIRLSFTAYQVTGIDHRQEPTSFFIHGTPTVSIKGFDIPFHFMLSNHHRTLQQPFNRLGIAPKYKWAKTYLGYNTMPLSKYTFSNRQFLGAGIELTPGKLRLAALYGRLQSAVREDSIGIQESGIFLSHDRIPRFERRAYGGKIGIGSPQSYFDIVGIKAFDVKDARMFTDTTALRPQENVALGIQSQFKLWKHFQLRLDVGASVFTRDTTSDSHELESSVAWVGNILQPKTSTQVLFAGEAGFGYQRSLWGIQINYRRIDPDYKSMGIYYLQTDMEQWSIAPQFTLLQKKLRIRGNLGIQKDNLYNTRLATSHRLIQSANVQWNQSRAFQLGAYMTNFGLTQTPGLRAITDSTRTSQINQSYGVSPSFFITGKTWQHQVFMNFSLNQLAFNKSALIPTDDVRTFQFNGNYALSPQKDNRFSIGGIVTWLRSDFGEIQTTNTGFGCTGALNDPGGKWTINAQAQYFINTLDENANGHSVVIFAQAQLQVARSLQCFLSAQLANNTTGLEETSFTEKQVTVGMQLQLGTR